MRKRPRLLRLQLACAALLFIPLFLAFPLQSTLFNVYGIQGSRSVPSASDFVLTIPLKPIGPFDWAIRQENTGILTINVTSIGNFSSPVTLEVGAIPSNSSGSLSPAQVTPPAGGSVTSTFALSTDWRTPVGIYNLTITGTSTLQLITHSITVTLFISPDGDFVVDAEPKRSPLVLLQGQCGNYNITVRRVGNLSAPVRLELVNSTDQIDWQFLPNETVTRGIGIASFSTLRVCAKDKAVPGSYTMTVLGTTPPRSGVTHTVNILLTIPAPVKAVDWKTNPTIIGLSGGAVCIIAALMVIKRLPRIRSLLRRLWNR
jgi:hypothetical protein